MRLQRELKPKVKQQNYLVEINLYCSNVEKPTEMCNNGYTSVLFFVLVQLLCKSNSLPTHLVTSEAIWTIEVPYGENVMLECQSNDENHIFDFWVVENQQVVIGPSNVGYDIRKFKYEILTGNLTIRVGSYLINVEITNNSMN